MRSRPVPRNFISGELAPWLDGIMNDLTRQGARTLENVVVKKRGAVTQRPGTYFVAETKDSTKASVLVPVTIDDDNSYVLEIGDVYIRFYKNHQRITYSGTTTIYEVTSPWSAAEVSKLVYQYLPNKKTLNIANSGRDRGVRSLQWTSDASWAISRMKILPVAGLIGIDAYSGTARMTGDLVSWVSINLQSGSSGTNLIAGSAWKNRIYLVDSGANRVGVSDDGEFYNWSSIGVNIPKDVEVNDAGIVTIVGGSGAIYNSYDNGTTWNAKPSPYTSQTLYAIDYNPQERVWKVVGSKFHWYSTDDGESWAPVTASSADGFYSLEHGDDKWVAGSQGVGNLYSSASVADPFVIRYTGTGAMFWTSIAYGNIEGTKLWVAVNNLGTVAISSNTTTWAATPLLSGTSLSKVVFLRDAFYIFGYTDRYWRTTNGVTLATHTIYEKEPYATTRGIKAVVDIEDYESEWFDTSGHYPGLISYHEGRVVLASTDDKPSTLWASNVNEPTVFNIGDYADQAWSYELGMDRNVDIQWIMGGLGGLVVGTRTGEGVMLGSPSEGITPNTAQFRWLSTFGSDSVQPVRVGNMVVFVQRGGEIVRGYIPNENAFQSPELTEYADHITKGGIKEIDHQEDPQNIVYFVRNDGQLLALTMDQGIRAWSRYVTDGTVESVAVIPTSGVEDEVWAIVNRTIGGSAKRYVECFAPIATGSAAGAHYVDCGVNTTSAVTFAAVGGMTHLTGEVVDALIDGTRVVSGLTVSVSGMIYVSPYSGTNIHAGLPYSATIQTMRGDYGSPYGDGAGFNKRTSEILVWVHDSMAVANFGPTASLISEPIQYSQSAALNTEVARINFPGTWDRDGYIWCTVRDPRPFTLVALSTDNQTGDR